MIKANRRDHAVRLVLNVDLHSKLFGIVCRDVQSKPVAVDPPVRLFVVSADKRLENMGQDIHIDLDSSIFYP